MKFPSRMDITPTVPESLSEEELLAVGKELCDDAMTMVAIIQLGFTRDELKQIRQNNSEDVAETNRSVLRDWMAKSEDNTRQVIYNHLVKVMYDALGPA